MDALEAVKTRQPSHRAERRFFRLIFWIAGLVAAFAAFLWGLSVRSAWESFQTDLTTYHGAAIGMTKTEVQYALDAPQTVQGPETEAKGGWKVSTPLRVNLEEENEAIPQGYGPVPDDKSATDYNSWHFWNARGSFDVDFHAKTQRVRSISCYSAKPSACDPLFGIVVGSSEKEILDRLGKPDKQEMSGGETIPMLGPVQVSKAMDYHRLGLHLILAKRAVTSITKRPPQKIGFWWWFTHGRIGRTAL